MSVVQIVNAIIQLDSFIPVIAGWVGVKSVVSGSLGRKLLIGCRFSATQVELAIKIRTGNLVEIVVHVKENVLIVVFSELFDICRLGV